MKITSNNVAFGHNFLVGSVEKDDIWYYRKIEKQLENAEEFAKKLKELGKDVYVLKFNELGPDGKPKSSVSTHILTDKHARPMLRLQPKIKEKLELLKQDRHRDIVSSLIDEQIQAIKAQQRDIARRIVQKVKSMDLKFFPNPHNL